MKISIDTRTLAPGDLYVALRGERYDGHDFVEAALAAGAARALIEESQAGRYPAALAARLEVVPDTLLALQQRAQAARRAWGGLVVAVTGSAGKTTTKEMIAAVLGTRLRVLKNTGNLNNHFGLPLTLLQLEPRHEVAVVEMGMNHAGEIARLAAIAEPNIGVFTNVGEAHIGNFDSIEGIAAAKRELAEAIPASGALVLNRDDARVARFGDGFGGRIVFYSGGGGPRQANANAALAAGELFGVSPVEAAAALAALPALPGRGEVVVVQGTTLINDCYNANPAAMESMLRVLVQTPGQRHIAVLGEMRELGAASPALHRRVGTAVAEAGVDALFAVGGDAGFILEGARAAGFRGPATFAENATAVVAPVKNFLRPGDVVLFKASRAIKLETALADIRGHLATGTPGT